MNDRQRLEVLQASVSPEAFEQFLKARDELDFKPIPPLKTDPVMELVWLLRPETKPK